MFPDSFSRGYIGRMEKKMETIGVIELHSPWGFNMEAFPDHEGD